MVSPHRRDQLSLRVLPHPPSPQACQLCGLSWGCSPASQRRLLPSPRDTESLREREAVGTQPKCTDLLPLPPTHLLPHHRVTHSLPSSAREGLLLLAWAWTPPRCLPGSGHPGG